MSHDYSPNVDRVLNHCGDLDRDDFLLLAQAERRGAGGDRAGIEPLPRVWGPTYTAEGGPA